MQCCIIEMKSFTSYLRRIISILIMRDDDNVGISKSVVKVLSLTNLSSHYQAKNMTTSNRNIFRVVDPCAGSSPATDEFPSQSPLTWYAIALNMTSL